MSKTPISILQELMVQKKGNLPDYYIENCSDVPGASFKCTVKVGSVKAIGYACTKKEAKQNSAKKALEILGYSTKNIIASKEAIVLVNCPTKQVPFINYVGKLNELASTHGKPYPEYHDEPMPNANGMFLTQCNFLEFSCLGCGFKKKDAKQDAARNMLEKVRDEDISTITTKIENLQLEKSRKLESLTNEIIQHYDKLNITISKDKPLSTAFLSIPNIRKTVFSLEDLGKQLEKYGYIYTVETFQTEPYIMMMKITDTNAIMMGKGESKQEALRDLFENAILMFDNGFSLNTEF